MGTFPEGFGVGAGFSIIILAIMSVIFTWGDPSKIEGDKVCSPYRRVSNPIYVEKAYYVFCLDKDGAVVAKEMGK